MLCYIFFFFNDTATTEIYTLSLHDALPISERALSGREYTGDGHMTSKQLKLIAAALAVLLLLWGGDRKSTRLNSSHSQISYAVFCLKKKNKTTTQHFSILATRSHLSVSTYT